MKQITSIKQQKDKNRINVYLDDKFGFGIDLDNFVILNLNVGQKITEKKVKEIIKKSEFQKTLDKLLKWSMGRQHSEKEIKDYLSNRKVPALIHKDLFSRLKHFELIDDEKFARWWVETRQAFSPKSKRVLNNELRIKGIKKEIINKILNENKIDEEKIAQNLLIKRKSHWENIIIEKRKQKMLEYLIHKGFDFQVAQEAIKVYNITEDDKI